MFRVKLPSPLKSVVKFMRRVFCTKKASRAAQQEELPPLSQVIAVDVKKRPDIPIIVVHPPPEDKVVVASFEPKIIWPSVMAQIRTRSCSVESDDSEASYQSFHSEDSVAFEYTQEQRLVNKFNHQGNRCSQDQFESLQSRRSSLDQAIFEVQQEAKVRPWSCPGTTQMASKFAIC
ncbi:hypothetical protein MP228_002566 [Amoeboaphelidium protococcarum]|nr:hypothetical protein MP228_002566 [Amoeboaphelidium protococcarum]